MYQVGFGDCFLMTLAYPAPLEDGRDERQILIDFGSTRLPKSAAHLDEIAQLIADDASGVLDVLVATHRHKDHVSGFGSDASAATIDALNPKLVVRSWTEDPAAPSDGTGMTSAGLVHRLRIGQEFAEGVAADTEGASPNSNRGKLAKLALAQLSNEDAVNQLRAWGDRSAAAYVSYGGHSRIEEFVPGIRVTVLGPPTLEQRPDIARQRDVDPDEFWMLYQDFVETQGVRGWESPTRPPEGTEPSRVPPGPVQWLAERLESQRTASFTRIVQILDDVLNNTSVILLFEIGDKRLLFPGDAQIENWEYALKYAPDAGDNRELLRGIDLYKVGHHGSRNATPRTLFDLWNEPATKDRPLTCLLSTLAGVHGETEETRVPRSTLVAALEKRASLHSTDGSAPGSPRVQVLTDASGQGPFESGIEVGPA